VSVEPLSRAVEQLRICVD